MTISTEIKVPFYSKARIYFRFWKNFQQQIKEAQIGNPPTKKSKQVVYDIAHRKKDMLKGAISEDIKKHFVDGQTDYFTVEEAEKRLKEFGTFTGEKHDVAYRKLPMQHKAIFLLEPLIKKYQTKIKSISNIGSGFDLIFEYLPPKYPKINFTSIDFGRTLERYHSVFPKQNNWNFMSGYALEMLQKGHLKSDVYLMSSTSVRFNNKELDLYIDEFAKHSKFVVFNEGWWFQYGLKFPFPIIKPEDISEDNSPLSGHYGDYHHNYIKKLEDRGFEILSSQIRDGSRYFALQIIAKNNNKISQE